MMHHEIQMLDVMIYTVTKYVMIENVVTKYAVMKCTVMMYTVIKITLS